MNNKKNNNKSNETLSNLSPAAKGDKLNTTKKNVQKMPWHGMKTQTDILK